MVYSYEIKDCMTTGIDRSIDKNYEIRCAIEKGDLGCH